MEGNSDQEKSWKLYADLMRVQAQTIIDKIEKAGSGKNELDQTFKGCITSADLKLAELAPLHLDDPKFVYAIQHVNRIHLLLAMLWQVATNSPMYGSRALGLQLLDAFDQLVRESERKQFNKEAAHG